MITVRAGVFLAFLVWMTGWVYSEFWLGWLCGLSILFTVTFHNITRRVI